MTIRAPQDQQAIAIQNPLTRTPEQQRMQAAEAARQFESLLVQQLVSVMRESAGGAMNSSGPAGQYMAMFDQAIAEHMTQGAGLGLQQMIAQTMDGPGNPHAQTQGTVHSLHASRAFALAMRDAPQVPSSPLAEGITNVSARGGLPARSAMAAAANYLSRPDVARRWAVDGALTHAELASSITTETEDGGTAAFSVTDAAGFEGHYKCNLFALETARRAGFNVPVQARDRGWGYPDPNGIMRDISQDGQLRGDWANIATSEGAQGINDALTRGQGFMLVGSGAEGRAGHMGIVERIHEIDYGADGRVRRVVFDGWEARKDGAQHLTRRTWNLQGNTGGSNARNGFERVEILQLKAAGRGQAREVQLSQRARSSVHDGQRTIPSIERSRNPR